MKKQVLNVFSMVAFAGAMVLLTGCPKEEPLVEPVKPEVGVDSRMADKEYVKQLDEFADQRRRLLRDMEATRAKLAAARAKDPESEETKRLEAEEKQFPERYAEFQQKAQMAVALRLRREQEAMKKYEDDKAEYDRKKAAKEGK